MSINAVSRVEQAIEALLLTADRPVSSTKLAQSLGEGLGSEPSAEEIRAAIAGLNEAYEQSGRAFRVESVAGGYRLMTTPEHADTLAAFHDTRAANRLGRAALETLAIVAYRQPITRAQLESIRGVGCGEILRSLIERRLVTVTGRAEELGRPMLYGTTRHFLDSFGLASVKDLPIVPDLQFPGNPQPDQHRKES